MNAWIVTGLGAAVAAAGIVGPRLAVRSLRRDPQTPIARFGFHVREPRSRRRVEQIIEAFFTGYNAALAGEAPSALRARCESLPPVLHPFAFEGTGMGYGARRLLDRRARVAHFERHIEGVNPGYRFLYYIGLGIWGGALSAREVRALANGIVARPYAGLVYDGFGFQVGFFHRVHDAMAHRRLRHVPEAEREHAYRGFGRSLWFVFRDDAPGLEAAVAALPAPERAACIVGVGLAVLFTSADDLAAAWERLAAFPATWRRDLERGVRLALYVRDAGQPAAMASWLAGAPPELQRTIQAHLDHARAAYQATCARPTFLHDFTEAC